MLEVFGFEYLLVQKKIDHLKRVQTHPFAQAQRLN